MKEKVTPEVIEAAVKELAKESTAPDRETPDWMESDIRRGILKGLALARKEGEERMKKMAEAYEIYRFRTIESGNKPDNIVTWIESYLPEKGDNNGK